MICKDNNINLKYFRSNALTFYQNVITPDYCPCGHGEMHRHLKYLLRRLCDNYVDSLGGTCSDFPSHKKIYVARLHDTGYQSQVPARQIVNESNVIDLLKQRDYYICKMEDYNFLAKLMLLRDTEVLIRGWGSGLINSMLSNSKGKVISLGLGSANNPAFLESSTMKGQSYY
jgi:hypothetical protein